MIYYPPLRRAQDAAAFTDNIHEPKPFPDGLSKSSNTVSACGTNPKDTRYPMRVVFGRKDSRGRRAKPRRAKSMSFVWTIVIGFVAGAIAKFITPGDNEPTGFVLTTILGIIGAFTAQFIGNALGFASTEDGVGLIGAVVGAVIVLSVWSMVQRRRR